MTTSFAPSACLEDTILRVQSIIDTRHGETLGQRLVGGLEGLLTLMDTCGYELFSYEGLDFDTSFDIEGNEVLLIHCTKDSNHGQWGLLWRSVWALNELSDKDLPALMRGIDQGISQLAQAAQLQAATLEDSAQSRAA